MAKPDAKPGDWKTSPMPEARTELKVSREYERDAMARIHRGLLPEEMEDKWFIVWDGQELHIHRSWTGFEIYSVRFEPTTSGARISHAVVNSDLDQYSGTPEREEAMLLWLIDALLLGRRVRFPM